MMQGARFITNGHMPGHGGSDLTPPMDVIVAAQNNDLLVATDPNTMRLVFFKPDTSKPPPAKLFVSDSNVPSDVLALVGS